MKKENHGMGQTGFSAAGVEVRIMTLMIYLLFSLFFTCPMFKWGKFSSTSNIIGLSIQHVVWKQVRAKQKRE